MSWIDDPWMGFDTETTGVRALKDRLVTAALVLRIDGASYRSGVSAPDQVATWLTDPGVEIPEQATAVHGITTEQAPPPPGFLRGTPGGCPHAGRRPVGVGPQARPLPQG